MAIGVYQNHSVNQSKYCIYWVCDLRISPLIHKTYAATRSHFRCKIQETCRRFLCGYSCWVVLGFCFRVCLFVCFLRFKCMWNWVTLTLRNLFLFTYFVCTPSWFLGVRFHLLSLKKSASPSEPSCWPRLNFFFNLDKHRCQILAEVSDNFPKISTN